MKLFFLDKDRVEVKFLDKVKESSSSSNIELAICLVKKESDGNYFTKSYRAWSK